jgi:hypothetical protein
MKTWARNKDLKQRLEKKWERGLFLSQSVSSESFEALRIPIKHPTSEQLRQHFDDARGWIDHWVRNAEQGKKKGYRLEWREINHRTLGRNKIPIAVIFETIDHIAAYLGKEKDLNRFQILYKQITGACPELAELLLKRPVDVLHHDGEWERLLSVISFLQQNPRPGIYIRQLEIPGVDTKFIERNKALLGKLLDATLLKVSVNDACAGVAGFENRYGFLEKPARIRFRILDPSMAIMGITDLEIPKNDFHNLSVTPSTVFIVENEINGLAFPAFPDAIVVFGLGYSLAALSGIQWMNGADIQYWGDLDTHGFAMLDQLRHYYPQTRSFLMDEQTLMAHKDMWGTEPTPVTRDLSLLTETEQNVYESLRQNRYAPNLRLEQERISYTLFLEWVASALNSR